MTFHDAYARITPYELAFPDVEVAEERLGGIRDDARERGQVPALADPGRFLTLPGVGEVLHEIRDPRSDAQAVQKHGILLYHAFHFEEGGRPLFLVETHVARYVVESGSGREGAGGDAEESGSGPGAKAPGPRPPAPSGYAQLPRNLFWIRPSGDGPPEPVDGLFWAAPDGERITVLVAAGIRGDRPGLAVVPLPTVPLDEARTWLGADVRPDGRDFESTLPGGDLERLYSLEAAGEVLKLVAGLFRYIELFPEAVREEAPRDGEPAEAEEPRASALPYRRVTLEEGGGPDRAGEGELRGGGAG